MISLPPHWVFVIVAALNTLLLTFLTPRFQVHDEFQHFFRSYQMSEMRLWGVERDGRGGGMLPSSLPEFVEHSWGTLRLYKVPPLGPHPLAETWQEFNLPLAPDRREFADFSGVVSYSPLAYLPQAMALAVGRFFAASPLGLMYLGRLANAFVAVAIIYWALRVLPIGRETALVTALFPTAQLEYASVAPDAAIIATAFLFTAIALRATVQRRWPPSNIFWAIVSGSVFCSIKPVYAPLLAIGLPAILSTRGENPRPSSTSRILIANTTITGCVIAASAAWYASAWETRMVGLNASSVQQQTAFILNHPLDYFVILARDIMHNARHYVADTIGLFGVWQILLPVYVYAVTIFIFFLSSIFANASNRDLPNFVVLWHFTLMVSVFILLETSLFILMPIGDFRGIQGRYLLPLGALVAAALSSAIGARRQRGAELVYTIVVVVVIFNSIMMDITIINDFHLF